MRPSILAFGEEMEKALARDGWDDSGEPGWKIEEPVSVRFLHDELSKKLTELRGHLNDCDSEEVASKSVDIANFSMMIWDRLTNKWAL